MLVLGEVETDEKYALMQSADVFVDTQVKDGLNIAPFEYLACHHEDRMGLVIVSEFSGCSRVLQGALAVNPWNTGQVVAACERCCRMVASEREERFIKDYEYCEAHSLVGGAWGGS